MERERGGGREGGNIEKCGEKNKRGKRERRIIKNKSKVAEVLKM